MNKATTKKGGAPKTPRDRTAGSSIKQFMSQGGSPKGGEQGAQGGSRTERRGGTPDKTGDKTIQSKENSIVESEGDLSRVEERRTSAPMLSKEEMRDMLKNLELSIKVEIGLVRADLGSLLERVETTEKKTEELEKEIINLKEQIKTSRQNQKIILYKIEDQENRDRRQNVRLRNVPENKGEDLRRMIPQILGPLLGEEDKEFPKIERTHRVGKLFNSDHQRPRDIIIRFRYYEDKALILSKMRGKPPVKFEGSEIQIYTDLASETLARRRLLKPLLDQMRELNIKYSWGFPACLRGFRDGRSARLRDRKSVV